MGKFFKTPIVILLLLALALPPVLAVSAQGAGTAEKYDPFAEGIVSSYYHIDWEKGFITGIAPGTTAQRLRSVCLPGGAVVSQEQLATGTTITVTCTAPIPPETTAPSTEATEAPTTAPPTEETVPPSDTTEPSTAETASSSETAEPPTEDTVPPSESTESSTEDTEASADTTDTPVLVRSVHQAETRTYTLTVIVTGDLNGDGNVTITDMLMLKSAILGGTLSDTAAAAADINYDGKITITDFLKIKSCLLGLETLRAGWAAGTAPDDPLLLMTPNSSETWSIQGAVSYASDDSSIASLDNNGTVTAQSGEGSTFVYALDGNGNVLARSIVTVLNEKLTVSLSAASQQLIKGQELTLTASFNHPVSAPNTWASSNLEVATVNQNGAVTTTGLGTATITATLPNGSQAECAVSVIPPLTAITFGKDLYKVKPGNSRTLDITLDPVGTGEELIWSSSNTAIATVSNDGTVTGVAYGTVTITVKGKYSGLTASCQVKICDVKQVAITFDDGPSQYTMQLLDYMREANIHATFFMVGNRLQAYSNTVKQMVADGHEIGYHSYAHTLQSYLSSDQIKADLKTSNQILKELTGAQFTVWRAPGGDYSTRILNCIALPHIMWSVDTRDWETQNSDSNYRAITRAKDGDIILLHDLYAPSVNGAIRAMKDMLAGDYEFLTVTELLTRNGTPVQNCVSYTNG